MFRLRVSRSWRSRRGGEEGDEFIDRLIGYLVHLLIGAILDGMGNKHPGRVESKPFGLGGRRVDKG